MQCYTTHRDATAFPDPDAFLPERWLASEQTPDAKTLFMPYSKGSRACLGKGLAQLQLKLVVSALISRYEVSLPPQTTEESMAMRDHFLVLPQAGKCDLMCPTLIFVYGRRDRVDRPRHVGLLPANQHAQSLVSIDFDHSRIRTGLWVRLSLAADEPAMLSRLDLAHAFGDVISREAVFALDWWQARVPPPQGFASRPTDRSPGIDRHLEDVPHHRAGPRKLHVSRYTSSAARRLADQATQAWHPVLEYRN
ncbi:hypothetical protein LTR53_009475 [Teratosphaeriaceae sp. CCFEE 6253]|nr:hypothetical protein LTR53_009475 [Teratosphaeriaceae sp. CCFEE 6253]